MPRKNNQIVLKKKCQLCTDGLWYVKHFNDNPAECRYASCSCGGQVRADNNQKIFYEDDTVTGQPDPTPPLTGIPPVTGSENTDTQPPTTGNPVTGDSGMSEIPTTHAPTTGDEGNDDEQEESEWTPY